MPELSHNDILKELKGGNYRPLYFLQGEETYFIDLVSDYIEDNALTDAEKGFNQTVVYGKDMDSASLLDTVMRYPMMASRQVVILKEAQDFRDLEKLEPYFKKPMASTVFVICHKHKKVRKNSTLLKGVLENGVLLVADKMRDKDLPSFIATAARTHKLDMPAETIDLLVQYLGTDLSKIEKQLEKLALNVEGRPVSTADIEKYIGISKEYNVFEFANALAARNAAKAFRIVNYFIANPKDNHPIMVLGYLYSFYSKVYAYESVKSMNDRDAQTAIGSNYYQMMDLKNYTRNYPPGHAQHALGILQEYDLKAKGVDYSGSDKGEILREMVFKLMA